ncbi:MAG: hypothetical protein ACRDX8_07070 [Acidimicrobiales bacterium]
MGTGQASIADASTVLVNRCLVQQGITYLSIPRDTGGAPPPPPLGSVSFGTIDTETAETTGFGLWEAYVPGEGLVNQVTSAPGEQPAAQQAINQEIKVQNAKYAALTPAQQQRWNTALNGTGARVTVHTRGETSSSPSNGCNADATKALYGSVRASLVASATVQNLSDQLDKDVLSASGVVSLEQAWSSCMATKGYGGIAQRSDVLDRVEALYTGATQSVAVLKAEEIALATADAKCAQQTDFVSKGDSIEATVTAKFLKAQQGTLTGYLEVMHKAEAKASAVLASVGNGGGSGSASSTKG